MVACASWVTMIDKIKKKVIPGTCDDYECAHELTMCFRSRCFYLGFQKHLSRCFYRSQRCQRSTGCQRSVLEIQPVDITRTLCASVGHSTRFPLKICRKSRTCWKILIFSELLLHQLCGALKIYKKNSFSIPTRHIWNSSGNVPRHLKDHPLRCNKFLWKSQVHYNSERMLFSSSVNSHQSTELQNYGHTSWNLKWCSVLERSSHSSINQWEKELCYQIVSTHNHLYFGSLITCPC
jgi:hypothetical protein